MKKVKRILIVFLLIGCTNTEPPSYLQILASGSFSDNKYSNSYFGLEVNIPRDWLVLNQSEIDQRRKMGMDLISKSIDTTDLDNNQNPRFLININKYPSDAQEALSGNGGFQISFLKMKYFPNESTLTFLDGARKIILLSPFYKNVSDIQIASMGGEDFYMFSYELHMSGYIVLQSSYILEINDCFLLIDISYRGDFLKPEIEEIVNSVRFSKH